MKPKFVRFHLADAEDRIVDVGVVAALGSAVKLIPDGLEKLRGRSIRVFPDVDAAGHNAARRIGQSIAAVATETQIFDLRGLYRDDDAPVRDLFDVTRIGYESFEANRDLWSVTNLDSKGERVKIVTHKHESFPSPSFPPHGSPESHGFPVYPVSNSQELESELAELAKINACTARNIARKRRFKLARDLAGVEKRIGRKLSPDELMKTVDNWHRTSQPHLDSEKTRDDYRAAFLAELGKVRVPTGEGEALKIALARIFSGPLPELPWIADTPESWRTLAALHRELARQSANGTYFLSCRDAAKAHASLNKDSANQINRALDRLGAIKLVRLGSARPVETHLNFVIFCR